MARHAWQRIGVVACLAFLSVQVLGVARAGAAGEVEPNNDIITATGPISATRYAGTLTNDDWYWVQLAGGQQVTLSTTFKGDCYFPDAKGYVREKRGTPLASVEAETAETDSFTTPAGGGAYYIQFEGGSESGCSYEFELTPSSAFAPPPAVTAVIPLGEPDDLPGEDHEIGAGAIYTGTLQTVNDVDRLYFPTVARKTVDVEIAAGSCGSAVEASISREGSSEYLNGAFGTREAWGSAAVPTKTGGRIDVVVEGGGNEVGEAVGCVWQLEISPAEAIGNIPPPGSHADPCRAAKRTLARRRARLHRLERTLRFASRHRRPAIRRQIQARKRAVRAARHAVRASCAKGAA